MGKTIGISDLVLKAPLSPQTLSPQTPKAQPQPSSNKFKDPIRGLSIYKEDLKHNLGMTWP